MISITAPELTIWSQYVHALCGVSLDDTKGYLLETRLASLLRETGAASFTDLHQRVRADIGGALKRKVVDAITTGETSFFRDTSPFDLLRHKVLPELIDRRKKGVTGGTIPIRIWSAACSSGQEVYSIAIVIRELLGDLHGFDVRILGTDISDRAVAAASLGKYTPLEIGRGFPQEKIDRYFTRADDAYKVRDELRALATFRTMNLLEPMSFPVRHDIVFCRNVAIYFTEPDRLKLFGGVAASLAPDGVLVIGSTESITGLCPQFEAKRYLRTVFYQLKGA